MRGIRFVPEARANEANKSGKGRRRGKCLVGLERLPLDEQKVGGWVFHATGQREAATSLGPAQVCFARGEPSLKLRLLPGRHGQLSAFGHHIDFPLAPYFGRTSGLTSPQDDRYFKNNRLFFQYP